MGFLKAKNAALADYLILDGGFTEWYQGRPVYTRSRARGRLLHRRGVDASRTAAVPGALLHRSFDASRHDRRNRCSNQRTGDESDRSQSSDPVDGVLLGKRYLIHDRDPLFTAEFQKMLAEVGIVSVKLPPRSPGKSWRIPIRSTQPEGAYCKSLFNMGLLFHLDFGLLPSRQHLFVSRPTAGLMNAKTTFPSRP